MISNRLTSGSPLPQWGAIFDWDGVLIDSSMHHEESWNRLAQEENRILPVGHFLQGFGMKNEAIIPGILGWTRDLAEMHRISLRKELLYREIIQEWGLELLTGARSLLDTLYNEGIPCAIGSSTHRKNITMSLEILGIEKYFRTLITAEDVQQGKPNPEVFLLAAKALELNSNRCVVFEDAPMGIEAALAGGMKAIGITSTHPKSILAKAHLVVRRLDEMDIDRLEGLFA